MVNPCHADIFMYHTPPLSACSIPVVRIYFQSEWKTVWILISWLHQKSADLDLQYFLIRIMHPSFVSTAPPPTEMAGIVTFQSPGISPALWGQADGNNPTLSPALHYRKSHRGKCLNFITPALLRHCGDNQKVLALNHSLAIPLLSL